MQILDAVQGIKHINRLPPNEVRYLQDSHCVDGDEDDPFDETEEEWPDHMSVISGEEFIERYVD